MALRSALLHSAPPTFACTSIWVWYRYTIALLRPHFQVKAVERDSGKAVRWYSNERSSKEAKRKQVVDRCSFKVESINQWDVVLELGALLQWDYRVHNLRGMRSDIGECLTIIYVSESVTISMFISRFLLIWLMINCKSNKTVLEQTKLDLKSATLCTFTFWWELNY